MTYFFLILAELVFLFFLSRKLTRSLSFLPINLISFIFLPGIILHELAHLLVASVLFVPTGEVEFMPKQEGESLKLGSVTIAKTDPLRRFLIGVAPILAGFLAIFAIFYFDVFGRVGIAGGALVIYVLFVIGNTMFSSKKDIEGSLVLLILILIVSLSLYILGFRIPIEAIEQYLVSNKEVLTQAALFLAAPIIIDLAILGLMRFLKRSY